MIRVLHLAAIDVDAPGAGMERVIRDVVEYSGARRSEHRLFALSPRRGRLEVGWVPALLRAARDCDVIHGHDLFGWALGPAIFRAARRPVVVHDHGASWRATPARRLLARATDARIAAYVAVSRAGERSLREAGGVAPEKIRVIWNGRDPATLAPTRPRSEVRRGLAVDDGDVLALVLARLAPEKGLDVLIDAIAMTRDESPRLVVRIAGEGPLRADLEARIVARGVGDRVALLGRRGDVPDLLAAADVAVLPSRVEPFGLALAEAALCGLPAVATRAGGIEDVVVDGETGLLVPVGDAEALAGALRRIAREPALRSRLGAAARARALDLFTLERQVRALDEVYACAASA